MNKTAILKKKNLLNLGWTQTIHTWNFSIKDLVLFMNDKAYSKSSPSPLIYADILYWLTLPNDFIYLNDFHLLCTFHKLTSFIGTDRQ